MKRGAVGTLQLIIIIAVLGTALTVAGLYAVHSIENTSAITANVENGLVSKPLN